MASKLTKSELAILKALDAAPDKIIGLGDLQKASRLTIRGFHIVLWRMEDASLLARVEGWGSNFTLTFKGMRSLAAEQVSA